MIEQADRMANELLASAGILDVLPSVRQKAEFAERALQTVLGLEDSTLCLKGYDEPPTTKPACAECGVKNRAGTSERFECPLAQDKNYRLIQIGTVDAFLGYLIIPEASVEKSHHRDDLLLNFLTILSISVENHQKTRRIQNFNEELQAEIEERAQVQQTLRRSEERYRSLFANMQEGLAYCRMLYDAQVRPTDFIYLDVNNAFKQLTGLNDVTGKRVTEAIPGIKESSPELFEIYGRVASTGKPEKFETHFKPLDAWLSISVYSTETGYFVAVFDNIPARKRADIALKSLLKEKEVLIREIHHRVKNNFSVVHSLLNLQAREMPDNDMKKMFMKSRDRIKSMALIHDRLYQAHDLTHINFAEYIRTLAADLYQAYGTDPARVSLVNEVDDVYLDVDKVIPCGLIVNELISNALKYGFPKSRTVQGQIKVSLHKIAGNKIELSVTDNGVGLPENFDIHQTQSLGLQIIAMLVEDQLGGKLTISGEGGTKFQIQFAFTTANSSDPASGERRS
jgi:two-component sensor histidine kinase/PAS domain-containing protein